jgi:hypothetical protein
MRGSVGHKFAAGAISKRAAEKFQFGTISENPVPLTVDDGGLENHGPVSGRHLHNGMFRRSRRG